MAYFKTEWLVLKVKKISENQSLYTIFFKDYGILTVNKKKKVREKPIDSWYLISCEIITKKTEDIHLIGNIWIISFFSPEEKPYKNVAHFLNIIQRIHTELPHWNPHYEIYDILSTAIKNDFFRIYDTLILTHLKIIALLWNLPDTNSHPTVTKTITFIHKYSFKEICKLWKIPEDTIEHLEKICSLS